MDIAGFLALMDLQPAGADRWIARSPDNGWKRVFGGQVLAQALVAAERSVEGRAPHSLHAYFILGGDPAEPIELSVERVRDGRSFSVRRVVARQRGEIMFVMSVSFQVEEEGALNHQLPMPEVPAPEATPDPVALSAALPDAQRARALDFFERISPIELRPLDPRRYRPAAPGVFGEPAAEPVDPPQGPAARRSRDPSRRAGLSLRHDPDRHRAGRARPLHHARPVSNRQPRPCRLVAPAVSRRRLVALRAG